MMLTMNSEIRLICYKDDELILMSDLEEGSSSWVFTAKDNKGEQSMNNKEQSKHIRKDLDNSLGYAWI